MKIRGFHYVLKVNATEKKEDTRKGRFLVVNHTYRNQTNYETAISLENLQVFTKTRNETVVHLGSDELIFIDPNHLVYDMLMNPDLQKGYYTLEGYDNSKHVFHPYN